ncbi:MAG: hypothetical protein EOL87_09380 [Spartobacteria bacterium]|nr:hypothetical protein [Spartobacteria bacterium]
MVKKKLRILGLVALLAVGGAFMARADVSVYGSRWFTDGYGAANGGGVELSLSVVPMFRVDLGAARYDDFQDEHRVTKLTVTPLEAGLSFHAPLGLYAGAGLGYYMLDVESQIFGVDVYSDNKLGCYGKAGWSIGIPYISVFAECKYTFVDTDISVKGLNSDITFNDDKLNGVSFNVGLTLKF